MKINLLILSCLLAGVNTISAQTEQLTNGGFETGDLTGWAVSAIGGVDDPTGNCLENWRVQASSVGVCGTYVPEINPTAGTSAAFSSFDSDVINSEWILEQTVMLPAVVSPASVSFDFALNIDFALVANVTIPRELNVAFYTTGGTYIADIFNDNTLMSMDTLMVAYSQNVDVTGLLAGLGGTNIVIRFTAIIPEASTGPGKSMIDNVSFLVGGITGVDSEMLIEGLSFLPNPATDILNISSINKIEKATIYSLSGNVVGEHILNSSASKIDVSMLEPGAYFMKVSSNGKIETLKFIKN